MTHPESHDQPQREFRLVCYDCGEPEVATDRAANRACECGCRAFIYREVGGLQRRSVLAQAFNVLAPRARPL